MATINIDEFGHVFTITVTEDGTAKDISLATFGTTVTNMRFRTPQGETVSKTAAFVTDGTDGQIDYTSDSGLFDTAGKWCVQAELTTGATGIFYTVPSVLTVNIFGC